MEKWGWTPWLIVACLMVGCGEPSTDRRGDAVSKKQTDISRDEASMPAGARGRSETSGRDDRRAWDVAQWREVLSPLEYKVTREKGTERAFSGEYWDCKTPGIYRCRCCGEPLFDAETKFASGTGWPSFFQPIDETQVATEEDNSLFSRRVEVHCRHCGAHLGHVFPDGPAPTGLRYCINSVSVKLDARPEAVPSGDERAEEEE